MVCDVTQTWVFILSLSLTASHPYINCLVKHITLLWFELIIPMNCVTINLTMGTACTHSQCIHILRLFLRGTVTAHTL